MTLPFPVPRQLFPVEHRFVDLDGARIRYVDEGSGDTLLLLHGNPAWSFLYRKIIAALKNDYRCVAPDFPGYGMSTAAPGYGGAARGWRPGFDMRRPPAAARCAARCRRSPVGEGRVSLSRV